MQPPNNITLNQVQPLRELEEAGVIKLEKPKPTMSLLPAENYNESVPIVGDAQPIVPQELVPVVNSVTNSLVQGRAVGVTGSSLEGQSLLKDTLVKNSGEQNGEAIDASNPALIPNKDGTFSFAFKSANEEMQHIQIIRSDGIKTEVLMELGSEKQDMVRPVRPMRVTGRMGGTNKNNECDLCGKILSSSTNLLRHKMYHSAERPFVCEVCNKGFKDISNLKKHTLIHKRIFPCYLCKKSFLRKSQLEVHLRRHESRTTFVKTGDSSKEVTMRTFVDADGSRVEEMSMTALGGQQFEYKNRIVRADTSSLNGQMKNGMNVGKDPISTVLDSSNTESLLQTVQDSVPAMKQSQIEGDKPVDKMFTVTMEGLQETPVPMNAMNKEPSLQASDPEQVESRDIKFPPPPEEFVKVYQCGHCGKRTVQRGNMMRHLIHHLKDRPFACDECPKRFVDKGELFKHKKTHSKPYRCPQCNGAFAHNVQLIKHLQKECLGNMENLNYTVMEDGQTYKCDICGVEMKRLGNMIKHVGTHSVGSCPSWSKSSTLNRKVIPSPKPSPGKPDAPYFYDSNRRAFFCGFCPKSFWKKANVQRHIQFHMKKGDQHKCHECDRSFSNSAAFQRHVLIHQKPFKCDQCHLAFSRKIFLDAHKKKHNGSEIPVETPDYALLEDKSGYFCKHCNTTLSKKYRMMSHVKKHVSGRPFECLTCNKCFSTAHLLLKHKKVHKKLFVCKKCGQTFTRKFSLSIHLKRNHPQQPRFASESIPLLGKLDKKEGGSEKYLCSYCGAPFSRTVIKLNHEKKCREESKVVERLPDGAGFRCKICGRTATLKHNLMVHVRRHDSVKIIDTTEKIVVANGLETASSSSAFDGLGKFSAEKSDSGYCQDNFSLDNDSFKEDAHLEDSGDSRFKRTPGGYACVICRRKFTDKDTMARHLESHESDEVQEDIKMYALKDEVEETNLPVTDGQYGHANIELNLPYEDTKRNPVSSDFPNQNPALTSNKNSISKKLGSTPMTKKTKQDVAKTPSVSINLEDSPTPVRSGGRPARTQKIPSRFLE